jgi:two-component system NtrC family sensor kinase
LATRVAGGSVVVTITDSGPGISAQSLAHIFEPFFTTKADGEGTGLGLSISRWIVEKLGGSIRVETEPGAGTSFHVSLPSSGMQHATAAKP